MSRAAASILLALAAAACSGRPPGGVASADMPLEPGYWEIASVGGATRPVSVLACLDDAEQLGLRALVGRIGDLRCGRDAWDGLRRPRPECLKDVVKLTSDATLHRSKTRFVLIVRTQLLTARGTQLQGRIAARGRRVGTCPVAGA